MEEQIQTTKNELTGLSIKDLFYKYIRFLPLFIISIALSLFVSYIYLRYATLIYQSTGILVIRDENSGNTNDKFEKLFVSDGKKNIQNEIEYLQSRPLMQRVVRALDLNFTYLAKGSIKELTIYKSIPFTVEIFEIPDSSATFSITLQFEDDKRFHVDNESPVFSFGQILKNKNGVVYRVIKNPLGSLSKEYNVLWQPTSVVAKNILQNLVVAPKQNTGILILSLEATNPDLAADIINQLMKEYQLATVEDKNDATRKTLAFIDERLKVVQRQLDSITNRIVDFREKNNIISPETQLTNSFARIEQANQELRQQSIQLNTAEMIDDYLQNKQNAYTPTPSALSIEDKTLSEMVNGYNKAQLERKALLENAPPGNIAVQQKEQEIQTLRSKIIENLRNIQSAYRSAIGNIQGSTNSPRSQIKSLPSRQQTLVEMERSLQSKLFVQNSLSEKREESAIALAATISNTKVLQDAMPNMIPIKPNRRNTRMLAILIGIVLPALFIFVLELLNDKVTTRHDIERLTSATILGEVGHSYNKETLVVTNNNRSVVAEQFRIIRSNLQYILANIEKPVILVTSSFSGEGKSFVSTNIGAVLALTGKKTIILEFDIRKPKILSQLHISKRPGLTNYILGKVRVEDLPLKVEGQENLFVLSCGPVPPNPAELLLDVRLNDLVAYLKNNFDIVVMDTAPVGMVSDAMTLSKFADCTLYIVRQGHTYKKQIGMIDEFYQEKKLPKIALILNDIKLRAGYGYYGYGRYGYGYGSGYFDEEDMPPATLVGKWLRWLDIKKWSKKKKKTNQV